MKKIASLFLVAGLVSCSQPKPKYTPVVTTSPPPPSTVRAENNALSLAQAEKPAMEVAPTPVAPSKEVPQATPESSGAGTSRTDREVTNQVHN